MDKGKGKRSPRYEVKGSPDTKIYKLKEILKNSIRVKVSSLTTTLFWFGWNHSSGCFFCQISHFTAHDKQKQGQRHAR